MTDDYEWVKPAKYYLVNFPFGDCGVSAIKDDEELQKWLKDGSFEDGNVIIEAVRLHRIDEEIIRNKSTSLLYDGLNGSKKDDV